MRVPLWFLCDLGQNTGVGCGKHSLLLRAGSVSSSWWLKSPLLCYWVTLTRHCVSYRAHPGKMRMLKAGCQMPDRRSWLAIPQRFSPFSLSLPCLACVYSVHPCPALLIHCRDLRVRLSRAVAKAGLTSLDAFGGPVGNVKEQSGCRRIQLRAWDCEPGRVCCSALSDCCYVQGFQNFCSNFCVRCPNFLRFPDFWCCQLTQLKKQQLVYVTQQDTSVGLQAASLPSR